MNNVLRPTEADQILQLNPTLTCSATHVPELPAVVEALQGDPFAIVQHAIRHEDMLLSGRRRLHPKPRAEGLHAASHLEGRPEGAEAFAGAAVVVGLPFFRVGAPAAGTTSAARGAEVFDVLLWPQLLEPGFLISLATPAALPEHTLGDGEQTQGRPNGLQQLLGVLPGAKLLALDIDGLQALGREDAGVAPLLVRLEVVLGLVGTATELTPVAASLMSQVDDQMALRLSEVLQHARYRIASAIVGDQTCGGGPLQQKREDRSVLAVPITSLETLDGHVHVIEVSGHTWQVLELLLEGDHPVEELYDAARRRRILRALHLPGHGEEVPRLLVLLQPRQAMRHGPGGPAGERLHGAQGADVEIVGLAEGGLGLLVPEVRLILVPVLVVEVPNSNCDLPNVGADLGEHHAVMGFALPVDLAGLQDQVISHFHLLNLIRLLAKTRMCLSQIPDVEPRGRNAARFLHFHTFSGVLQSLLSFVQRRVAPRLVAKQNVMKLPTLGRLERNELLDLLHGGQSIVSTELLHADGAKLVQALAQPSAAAYSAERHNAGDHQISFVDLVILQVNADEIQRNA
mmetsp:Transcript_22451/g.57266  ORF Transcript_22451/g.57266 Transcript_22451/m.57266 type:complete len:572 (+) Transcript_22451:62-1777(+)